MSKGCPGIRSGHIAPASQPTSRWSTRRWSPRPEDAVEEVHPAVGHNGGDVMAPWTRRQVLTQMGLAAAAVHTLDPHELCCTMAAHAQTADKDLFELKKVGDGVYGAIAHPRYKTNCNGAVILTDDGIVVVDTHSKPSASKALYAQIQEISKKPVVKV